MIRPDPDKLDRLWVSLLSAGYRQGLRRALFASHGGDAEAIHHQMIDVLAHLPRAGLMALRAAAGTSHDPVRVAGIEFAGRYGLAAGLDKDGRAALAWSSLGFAFAELGTITPRPQSGNDQPRVFRLPHSHALVNRMGFNNDGVDALSSRLEGWGVRRGNRKLGIPVGVSIGRNKATPNEQATDDYLTCLRPVAGFADYVAVNVSSPNTPGLRDLQGGDELAELLTALTAEAERLTPGDAVPIFLKLAPDLTDHALDQAAEVAEVAGIRALIATNTTLSRAGIDPRDATAASQSGGLSGAPLTRRAREVVARLARRDTLPVIGSGGVMSVADGRAMRDAGASLVQLYTGFIYGGPGLVRGLNHGSSRGGRP